MLKTGHRIPVEPLKTFDAYLLLGSGRAISPVARPSPPTLLQVFPNGAIARDGRSGVGGGG
jgi:hypothetical protein